MKSWVGWALVACWACSWASSVTMAQESASQAPKLEGPYETMFDGKSLKGWDGDPRLWSVKEGVIHGETTAENRTNGNTFLIWRGDAPADFEFRFSFRCNASNNSGVQYRSKHFTGKKARNKWVVRGYQHEIRNENKLPSVAGFIYDEGGRRGRICLVGEKAVWSNGKKVVQDKLVDQAAYQGLFHLDDWNDVVIVAQGRRLRHYLNGRLILDFTDGEDTALLDGVIALQLHQGKPMWAEYRDLKIRSLQPE